MQRRFYTREKIVFELHRRRVWQIFGVLHKDINKKPIVKFLNPLLFLQCRISFISQNAALFVSLLQNLFYMYTCKGNRTLTYSHRFYTLHSIIHMNILQGLANFFSAICKFYDYKWLYALISDQPYYMHESYALQARDSFFFSKT